MKISIRSFIHLLVLLALLLTSAVAFAQDEIDTDSRTAPFVGIRFADADDGVLVTGVLSNTPAAAANLEVGDVIVAVDEIAVDATSIQDAVWGYDVNDTITLSIKRGGETFEQDVTLMARPEDLFSNPAYGIASDPAPETTGQWLFLGGVIKSTFGDNGFVTCGTLVWQYHDSQAASAISENGDEQLSSAQGDYYLVVRFVAMGRRKPPPRHRPRPRPRLDISHTYTTDSIRLGYGDGFIEVQELSQEHELYLAGLRQFDLITSVNDTSIQEADDLFSGDTIALGIERGDEALSFDVPTSAAPLLMFGQELSAQQNRAEWLDLHEKQVSLGLRYMQLEADSPAFYGTDVTNGAYVAEVIEGLPAAEAGIQVGDIVVAVDGLAATTEIDLRNRIYAHRPGEKVTLDVLRAGELIQLEVVLRTASS